jgi:hypothetical protein
MSDSHIRVFTAFDALLIAVFIAFAAWFYPLMRSAAGDLLIVSRDNNEIARYPLNEDCLFTVKGRTGDMSIEIKNRRVKILSSTCPRNICAHHSPISKSKEGLVCVPNHIILEIRSADNPKTIDALAR